MVVFPSLLRPQSVLDRLAEQVPPSPDSSDPLVPPVPDSEIPVDVDVVAEQAAEEAATAEFIRWFEMSKSQRERHVRERRKKRRELKEARIAKAFDSHLEIACAVMKAEKARKLLQRENDAKGHIIATEEEVAQGLFKESDQKELARWCLCSVFDLSSQTLQTEQGVKAVSLRWVRTWKLKDRKRVAKSRLVARGFQDSRDWGMLETYSGTADPSLARVTFLWAVSRGLQAVKMDVSTAFLQAPIKDAVWLRLPSELPVKVYPGLHAGVFIRIQKAVYGLKDAPKVYTSYFKKKVHSLGWTEISESILVRRNRKGEPVALLVMHVDDLFLFSPSVDEDVKGIQGLFDIDKPERMDNGELHLYVGMSIRMRPGEMLLDQSSYIQGMSEGVSEKARKPLTEKDLLLPEEKDVDLSLQAKQQKNVGCLGWAVKTQPSLSFLFSHLSRLNSRPSRSSVLTTEKALWHARETARPLRLSSVSSVPCLLVWGDASYELVKKEGRLGIEMQLVDKSEIANLEKINEDNTVFWLSKKLARKLGSTTSAELLAMRDAVKSSWSIAHLVRKLWGKMPPIVVVTDSQPLMFQLSSKQCKSEPRMQGELEYVLENLAELGAKVKWVQSGSMRADR